MESQKNSILVPTDFSQVSEYAVAHAVKFSKLLNKGITLLHIVKSPQEFNEADDKIKVQAKDFFEKYGVHFHTLVQEGSIFSTIGEVANMSDTELIIMGTHGIHGLQKITGSWALRVTVSSKAPVIIVQDYPRRETMKRIVFPVDFKKENKEKIGWACFVARHFEAKIFVLKPNLKDKGYLRAMFTNMFFTEKYFKNKGVDYEVVTSDKKGNFNEQIVDFSYRVDADIILIMTTPSINYADYILGAPEQHIMANQYKIPVMCVNPRNIKVGEFSATGN
jgi:nucleotide-binding universal stress UspA family protein